MITKRQIIRNISQHDSQIKEYGVKKIGVFGSFARSKQTGTSDIDILVEFKKGEKTFDNYMGLKEFLGRLLGRKIDLVVKEALKPRIKFSILKEVEYA